MDEFIIKKQRVIGNMSNLASQMILKGASNEEFIRLIEYSRAVMDNNYITWRSEYSKFNIKELEAKYR